MTSTSSLEVGQKIYIGEIGKPDHMTSTSSLEVGQKIYIGEIGKPDHMTSTSSLEVGNSLTSVWEIPPSRTKYYKLVVEAPLPNVQRKKLG